MTPSHPTSQAHKEQPLVATGVPVAGVEHKAERTSGWMWDEEAKDFIRWKGIAVRWRFVGERKWRKQNVIPDAHQTQDYLLAQAGKIAEALASQDFAERAHRLGYYRPRSEWLEELAAQPPPPHGTESRYSRPHHCRCALCREAVRIARARRRQKVAA
jgi:hypothetical protein